MEEAGKEEPQGRPEEHDNIIFVGKKPAMSYVMAVVTQFSSGADEVHIRARGRAISRAVDVAEIASFDDDVFTNVNTQADLDAALKRIGRHRSTR